MNLQPLIDRYYHAAYDRIWQQHEQGIITAEQALQRCEEAHARAWARITRETGYDLHCAD